MKMMTQMVEAQPGTGSSKISFRTMMATRTRKEKPVMVVPNQEAMVSGT